MASHLHLISKLLQITNLWEADSISWPWDFNHFTFTSLPYIATPLNIELFLHTHLWVLNACLYYGSLTYITCTQDLSIYNSVIKKGAYKLTSLMSGPISRNSHILYLTFLGCCDEVFIMPLWFLPESGHSCGIWWNHFWQGALPKLPFWGPIIPVELRPEWSQNGPERNPAECKKKKLSR